MKIAVLVGSLRKGSFNRMAAKAMEALAPADLKFEFVEIGDLPFFNEDLEKSGNEPASWGKFREKISRSDGVLFFTPEYNRSVPAVLKNAIDVGSRPYGKSVWAGKPGGVVSVSPGASGGFGANHHLRQSMVFLDVPTLQQPELYIGKAGDLFAEDGTLKNDRTKEILGKFVHRYSEWVKTNSLSGK